MIVHSVSVSGFKMIGEPIRIEFPEEGRIGIFGRNESGKSTLLESIEYALYGLKMGRAPGAAREDVVTWGKPKANLTIEFTSGENRYFLERTIGAKGGHTVKFYVLLNGQKELITSSVRRVEQEIERITGMDRDTFTKLVFIKQKDLDALKKLSRANREQLVNKVMGMEVFDDSVNRIAEDLKELKRNRTEKDIEFESVKKNKETFEESIEKKKELEKENKKLQRRMRTKKKKLDEKGILLKKYEWLGKKIASEKLLKEMGRSLKTDQKTQEELQKLRGQVKVHTETLKMYKPKVSHLKEVSDRYKSLEDEVNRLEGEIRKREKEKNEEVSKSKLSLDEIKELTLDLPKRKTRQLMYFVILLILGLGLLGLGFVDDMLMIGIAILLLLISSFSFRNYYRLDQISGRQVKIQAIMGDIETKKDELEKAKTDVSSLKGKEGFESSVEVEKEKRRVLSVVKDQTGIESIEGLEEVLKNNKRRVNDLEKEKLGDKIRSTKRKISMTKTGFKNLKKSEPKGAEKITYTENRHDKVKNEVDKVREEYYEIKKPYDENKGKIKELINSIKNLRPDYERFPTLNDEIQKLQKDIEVRERALQEIKETSKELRNKVLPLAGFIVNRILPTITDGRYSDFKITEDLKFKVHSMEAGKYKEREVFSGGTQDQFLIALRLAFTESILDSRVKADYYSLLMDECISSSDEVRKQGIFEVLELMKKTFRQLFIIAHEDISNLVDHHLILSRNTRGYTRIQSKSW